MEKSSLQSLEDICQDDYQNHGQVSQIRFTYIFHSNGPYGNEGSRWQAVYIKNGNGVIDYGSTLDEAARRVLDRVQHPEKYPELNND